MSRFISAGTSDDPPTERDEAWQKAQQELEVRQLQKAEAGKQQDGKTLYETLQANKAAKQEAFEEANRLRNQFRSLDEDEVDFLDNVLESERAKEAEVRSQTAQELEVFRRQQEEAGKATVPEASAEVAQAQENWSTGPRKRKKGKESIVGGVKLRKTSTTEKKVEDDAKGDRTQVHEAEQPPKMPKSGAPAADETKHKSTQPVGGDEQAKTKSPEFSTGGLGLVAYSSDEDE